MSHSMGSLAANMVLAEAVAVHRQASYGKEVQTVTSMQSMASPGKHGKGWQVPASNDKGWKVMARDGIDQPDYHSSRPTTLV